jgi:hypothetical protein
MVRESEHRVARSWKLLRRVTPSRLRLDPAGDQAQVIQVTQRLSSYAWSIENGRGERKFETRRRYISPALANLPMCSPARNANA